MSTHQTTSDFAPSSPALDRAGVGIYVVVLTAGLLFWWLCQAHAALLPFWAPWDFSWIEFLTGWLTLWWYCRGLVRLAPSERPSRLRQATFVVGMLLIYVVVETRFEYLAEHQFFYNRMQHVVMHHLGPFLIALAWPGAALMSGMPAPLRHVVNHPAMIRAVRIIQQPVLAAVLFSGSFFFWLIPAVHFHAMIDPDLYALMNWTMIGDGILFWCLVLDPRPKPPARASFGTRAALAFAVMFPQIIVGAVITFSSRDLYTFYDLCGRIYPELGAHVDQSIGGLILWIPPAMMSVAAVLLVLNMLRKAEEAKSAKGATHERSAIPAINAARWTGL